MKQVWKCSYCSEINENKEKIKIHEKECEYNPQNESCAMCKHSHELLGYSYYIIGCDKNVPEANENKYDIDWCSKFERKN